MSATTNAAYYAMALARPAKAVRYLKSIRTSLADPNLHPTETMRLTEAEAGIIDGLRFAQVCSVCGRALETLESVERGIGPECNRKLAVRS